MITTKQDLNYYIKQDMKIYYEQDKFTRFMYWLVDDPLYQIARYLRYLRKEEYYYNCARNKFYTIMYLFYFRQKNKLGNKLGFKIPHNCFGPGLQIFHHGEIIVNEKARIGKNAYLHGGNCIGNNGIGDQAPQIGDDLDLGIGAKIIGGVKLGNGIRVGANAVVTRSFNEDDITLVGIPARNMKENK